MVPQYKQKTCAPSTILRVRRHNSRDLLDRRQNSHDLLVRRQNSHDLLVRRQNLLVRRQYLLVRRHDFLVRHYFEKDFVRTELIIKKVLKTTK